MAIRGKDEETKNGMTIITNMNGEKRANEKLEAKYEPGITSKELNKLPGDTIQEKKEKKIRYKSYAKYYIRRCYKIIKEK